MEVAIAVVFDQPHQRILICKRKAETVLGGYWEFPGGKCDAGETPQQCVLRETKEELGIEVRTLKKLPIIEHDYPHALVRLHPFLCEWMHGHLQLLAVDDARWINPAEAAKFRFPEANETLVRTVLHGFDRLLNLET